MTKKDWKTIINLVCTILSAIAAGFCSTSCLSKPIVQQLIDF